MPTPALPPTPGPSAEITAKEHAALAQNERPFNLPPSAYVQPTSRVTDEAMQQKAQQTRKPVPAHESSAQPFQTPKSPARKRTASQAALGPDSLSLPPPPSRSRKIIQVKPKDQERKASEKQERDAVAPTTPAAKTNGATAGKKKQAGGSTAGRKIARKTAHSLIERRRRSKMNEEFGVLKDMIPACAGQEMHKLAILQACKATAKAIIDRLLIDSTARLVSTTCAIWRTALPT